MATSRYKRSEDRLIKAIFEGHNVNFTIKDAPNTLCSSCGEGTTVRFKGGGTRIKCHRLEAMINRPVTDCDSYEPKNATSLYEMKETAWILEHKGGKVIGFKGPKNERD